MPTIVIELQQHVGMLHTTVNPCITTVVPNDATFLVMALLLLFQRFVSMLLAKCVAQRISS
jgi:hypothetical protein